MWNLNTLRRCRSNSHFAETETTVTVGVADGIVYYEGDIMLGNLNDIEERGVAKDSQRWTDSTIPYEIGSGFSSTQVTRINDAIVNVNANTNLCVVPRTGEANYVEFVPASGCSSFVGMIGGRQPINLASGCSFGSTIHEILHAAGIWHEQSREDRDQFVTIHTQNIQSNRLHNFNQQINGSSDYGAYDYGSIMHYGNYAFSANGQQTITTIPPGIPIGQRNGLSAGDISTVNTLYSGCETNCSAPTTSEITFTEHSSLIYLYAQPYNGITHQFRYRLNGGAWQNFSATTSHYNTITPKQCGTYEVQLRQKCGSTWSSWSAIKTINTTNCCDAPASSEITYTEHSTRIYLYAHPYYGDTHQFRYRFNNGSWKYFSATTSHYNTITPKQCGTYKVQLRQKCGSTWSSWSPVKTITSCQ